MLFVLSGGGTAGHINPALALAEILQDQGHAVLFAGTPQGIEAKLVQNAGIAFTPFEARGFNRNHPTSIFKALQKTVKSTGDAKKWLKEVRPDAVICFGGYVCIAVGRAAKSLGIPLVIHEQNSVMGLANKYLAKSASRVALTYEDAGEPVTDKEKITITGNPVRKEFLEATRSGGRELLAIPDEAFMLLVFGGSQGARHINEAVVGLKNRLLAVDNLHIVHLTGQKEFESVTAMLALSPEEEARWHVIGYQDRMGETLAAADAVIARTGATSLAEISALCKPALLVPFPYATDDHQTTNALAYVEQGAASMIADAELESTAFADMLFELIGNPALRSQMSEAAARFATKDAASRLADVVIAAAQESSNGYNATSSQPTH